MLQPHQGFCCTLAVWRNWQTQWTQKPTCHRVKPDDSSAMAVPYKQARGAVERFGGKPYGP